jgi:hypothetical protein
MVRTEIPLIGIQPRVPAISSEEDISACFTVEKLQDA